MKGEYVTLCEMKKELRPMRCLGQSLSSSSSHPLKLSSGMSSMVGLLLSGGSLLFLVKVPDFSMNYVSAAIPSLVPSISGRWMSFETSLRIRRCLSYLGHVHMM